MPLLTFSQSGNGEILALSGNVFLGSCNHMVLYACKVQITVQVKYLKGRH